jgi:DNA-directed RNA polymerase subunit RPC12/RpoP
MTTTTETRNDGIADATLACPQCGERRMAGLEIIDGGKAIRCLTCGERYAAKEAA